MSLIEIAAPPIATHGAEDTYNEFDLLYPPELRADLSRLALGAARLAAPNLQAEGLWASGFPGGYGPEELAATDLVKLARESSAQHHLSVEESWMGFEGDDSNEANVAEREVYMLREEKRQIVADLNTLQEQGALTPGRQAEARARAADLDKQIEDIRAASRAAGNLPIYYATPAGGILDSMAEDNPLSYIGDIPGIGHLALYDGHAISADPQLRVTQKTDRQVRIAGSGLQLMRHALAVVRLEFVDE